MGIVSTSACMLFIISHAELCLQFDQSEYSVLEQDFNVSVTICVEAIGQLMPEASYLLFTTDGTATERG